MERYLLKTAIFIVVLYCSCASNSSDIESRFTMASLSKELEECKKTVEELQKTPATLLADAQKVLAAKDTQNATLKLYALIEKFPSSAEAVEAGKQIAQIKDGEIKKQAEDERKAAMGFKAFSETSTVQSGDVTLKVLAVEKAGKWIFDRYDDTYRYLSAERGNVFITTNLSITSESKDPSLPVVLVYKVSQGMLNMLGQMRYHFYKWEDYGTYLGNSHDLKNDFAYTKTIKFSCGLQIDQDDFNGGPIFVVIKKDNCMLRNEEKYDNPPVSYSAIGCSTEQVLEVGDVTDDYAFIKIFNKNKL